MAGINSTATPPEESRAEPELEYNLQLCGDVIYGTKEQLQSIGLGAGIPFPGEAGETREKIKVTDPRGFTARIWRAAYKDDGVYCASIWFPDCDRPDEEWKPYSFGVKKKDSVWGDEYIGTGEALASAGLVRIDQLPGQPGMRKVVVSFRPDGTVATDNKNIREWVKTITKSHKTRYTVLVKISDEEEEKRRRAHAEKDAEWAERMAALPRPEPLHISGKQIPPAKKKEDHYDSPESFKRLAFNWVKISGRSFECVFGGEAEQREYGEVTMKLDDQSVREIASVMTEMSARLTALVSAAKVVRVRPYLSVVK